MCAFRGSGRGLGHGCDLVQEAAVPHEPGCRVDTVGSLNAEMAVVNGEIPGADPEALRLDGVAAAVESQIGILHADAVPGIAGHIERTVSFKHRIYLAVNRSVELRVRTAVDHAVDSALWQRHSQLVTAQCYDTCSGAAVDVYAVENQLYLTLTGIDSDAAGELTLQHIAARLGNQQLAVLLAEIHVRLREGRCSQHRESQDRDHQRR